MTHSGAAAPAVQSALHAFIDYAGLFPPAELGMARAADRYDEARRGRFSWVLGRFVVPASRLGEIAAAAEGREPFDLSVILDAGDDPVRWLDNVAKVLDLVGSVRDRESAVRIGSLEMRIPQLQNERDTFDAPIGQFGMLAASAGVRDLPIFVEIPRGPRWGVEVPSALFALSRSKLGAKVRCGGASSADIPTSLELAQFVATATEHSLLWKATAGLHHPVRRSDASTGLLMHGFLNLLCAAVFARPGTAVNELQKILEEEDSGAFALDASGLTYGERHASAEEIAAARRHGFVSYGSCSFDEPIADLAECGVL
ncbi:MAG: hypothetical protein M3M96_01345 [Candidatus Eremiobacteraeota bacterium]|nr:hypothetical protein [Candidatus Eremiobacteraeota bacterium]